MDEGGRKEEGRKETSSSLYSLLADTVDLQLAKAASERQSEVGGSVGAGRCPPLPAQGVALPCSATQGGCAGWWCFTATQALCN